MQGRYRPQGQDVSRAWMVVRQGSRAWYRLRSPEAHSATSQCRKLGCRLLLEDQNVKNCLVAFAEGQDSVVRGCWVMKLADMGHRGYKGF